MIDYESSDIRWSIHEQTFQIGVYSNGVLMEAYEMEIESTPDQISLD